MLHEGKPMELCPQQIQALAVAKYKQVWINKSFKGKLTDTPGIKKNRTKVRPTPTYYCIMYNFWAMNDFVQIPYHQHCWIWEGAFYFVGFSIFKLKPVMY